MAIDKIIWLFFSLAYEPFFKNAFFKEENIPRYVGNKCSPASREQMVPIKMSSNCKISKFYK